MTERYADLSFLGPEVEPEMARRIADGEIHPTTLEPFTEDDMAGIGSAKPKARAAVQEGKGQHGWVTARSVRVGE